VFLTYVLSVTELYSYMWLKWYVLYYVNLSQLKMNKNQKQTKNKAERKPISLQLEALGNMIHLANHSYDSVSRRLQGTAVFQTE